MRRWMTTGAVLLGLGFAGACVPTGLDGQRLCSDDPVDCTGLVARTCGDDNRCADDDSCKAARRLAEQGSDGACQSAWCDLGESYCACP